MNKISFNYKKALLDHSYSGGWVEHIYTGVAFFIINGNLESGISINPTADFSDFMNYERYLSD